MKTRFAPSLTGYLHQGHLVNAIWTWGLAQAMGGEVIIRVEDHDQSRARPEFLEALEKDLQWLGFWDLASEIQVQSQRNHFYQEAFEALQEDVYPCQCSRKDIQLFLEKHPEESSDTELRYPNLCRDNHNPLEKKETAYRLRLPHGERTFNDLILGPQSQNPWEQCGDFILKDKQGHWSYQFACVVDDFESGITNVIRGTDLLESTGRQLFLHEKLGNANPPIFAHHHLLKDSSGRKLSKRQKDFAIAQWREEGKDPKLVLGEIAFGMGLIPSKDAVDPASLGEFFTSYKP